MTKLIQIHVYTIAELGEDGAYASAFVGATREHAHDAALDHMKDIMCERYAEEDDPSYIVDWRSFTSVREIVKVANKMFWSNCMEEFSEGYSVQTIKASDVRELA